MSKQEEKRAIIITKYLENTNKSYRLIARELKFAESTVRTVIKRYKETLSIQHAPVQSLNLWLDVL